MAIDKTLLSGSTTMLLLKLLSEKDMYGYEMIEELKKRSENIFALKAGTLYPLLHGMEDKGLLTCYEQEFQGKIRKYYAITDNGQKELHERKNAWQEYSQAVADVLCAGLCRGRCRQGRAQAARRVGAINLPYSICGV